MPLRDQSDDIPYSIVKLSNECWLDNCECRINAVFRSNWWEYNNQLYIEYNIAHALDLFLDESENFFCPTDEIEVIWIAKNLKRGSKEDGFYHA
jgi:hypothetical protein